jgi:putative DNA primase/helicase
VRIIRPPEGAPEGWDIADAIAEGVDLSDFMRENVQAEAPVGELITADESIDDANYPAGQPPKSALVIWQSLPLAKDKQGVPHANLSNGSIFLQFVDEFKGKIWLDTFRDRIYHTLRGATLPWTDADTRRVTAYFQQKLNLPNFAINTVDDAVQHAAEANPHNSVQEWLDGLEWDGTARLDTWLADFLSVDYNVYTKAVARKWLIGMCARAYDPGCKMDHMPVLEGRQGLSKSTFLDVLGGEWYKSLPMQFGEKDFLQAIQGAWLVEIPDMTGFSQREHGAIISTISIRRDEYRKSYGRRVEAHPRVTVFAATSEKDNYLKSQNGRRRYWPLKCTDIHIDGLRKSREQLFAEAVIAYRAGEDWWAMPEEADAEQRSRAEPDVWAQRVINIAEGNWSGSNFDMHLADITCTRILESIGVSIDRQTQSERNRVSTILEDNGWDNKRTANARLFYKKSDLLKRKGQ